MKAQLQKGDRVLVYEDPVSEEKPGCEHPEWETSQAKKIMEQLRRRVITHLPGYEKGKWEID